MSYKRSIEIIANMYSREFISDTLKIIPQKAYEELCEDKFNDLPASKKAEILSDIFYQYVEDNIDTMNVSLDELTYRFNQDVDINKKLYNMFLLDVQEDIEEFINENYEPIVCDPLEEHRIADYVSRAHAYNPSNRGIS